MLDIDVILNNADIVKKGLDSRGFKLNFQLVKKLTSARKEYITTKESLAAEKNILIKKFKESSVDSDKEKLKNKSKELESEINKNKASLLEIQTELNNYLLGIPNIPDEDVPVGKNESDNKTVKEWGTILKNSSE